MRLPLFCKAVVLILLCQAAGAAPLETAFTYQGSLEQMGVPANGLFEFVFELHSEAVADAQIGATQTVSDVTVTDGVFSVELDFGATPFAGDQLWIAISVKEASTAGDPQPLSPRQKLTAAPYALHAEMVAAGAVGAAEIVPAQVQQRVTGSCAEGSYVRQISEDGSVICDQPSPRLNVSARGSIRANGTFTSASSNVLASRYDATFDWYAVTLATNFNTNVNVGVVSLLGISCAPDAQAIISSTNGELLVIIRDSTGNPLQCPFQFVALAD